MQTSFCAVVAICIAPLAASASNLASCIGLEDQERLACYDAVLLSNERPCELEAWKLEALAGQAILRGAATCEKGSLAFRLFSGDDFVTAGQAYVRGFVVEGLVGISEVPENLTMRYVITE